MCRALCALGMAAMTAAGLIAQAPARDARGTERAGSGVITGVVLLDGKTPVPLRRVSVTLTGGDVAVGRTAITEDDGRFKFAELPPGRFTVSASKEAFVTVAYGATRPGRPGGSIALKAGETRQIQLRMPRGGVITGVVSDDDGQPVPGAAVRVLRYSMLTGERQLISFGSTRSTDDRGMYRIYGLEPGEYVVSVNVRPGILGGPDVRTTTDAEVAAAKRELAQQGPTRQAQPGTTVATPASAAASLPHPRTSGYAPVYFPGTSVPTQATMVAVRAGEERTGIDIQLQPVPMARIAGTVVAPRTATATGAMVTLISSDQTVGGAAMDTLRTTRATADGTFALNDVPPGRYTLFTRGADAAPAERAAARSRDASTWWGRMDVAVDGADLEGLLLDLLPGLNITGRLVFEGTSSLPDNLARAAISLTALQGGPQMSLGAMPAPPDGNGAFTISGVTPGRYRLNATLSAAAPERGPWTIKSVVVNGSDTLDNGFDVRQDVTDVVVTLTDRPCELSGVVRGPTGELWPDGYVIAFARDESFWGRQSRRIRAVRPASDGRFTLSGLPPGDYLVVPLTDVEQNEWFDPSFLRRISAAAVAVSLAESEKKSLQLVVARMAPT